MLQQIDISRCVWDMDYRRMVKAILNAEPMPVGASANQNHPANRPDTLPPSH